MKLAAVLAVVLGATVPAPLALAAPANDDFADGEVLSGGLPISRGGSNVGATREEGEPFHGFGAGHTIWYEWTAADTGFVTVGTCGSSIGTEVAVYTGSAVNALTKVADTSNGGPGCPPSSSGRQATFKAVGGTAYEIAIDGNGFYTELPKPVTEGAISLQVEATPPPANDDFAEAAILSGRVEKEPGEPPFYFASTTGYNWGAGKQLGEPEHAGDQGGASVWFSWTAPATGIARFSAQGNRFQTLLSIYSGDSLDGLTPLSSGGFLGTEAPVTAGTTYRIAVDGKRDPGSGEPSTASFWLYASMRLPLAERPASNQPLAANLPDTTPPQTSILHLRKPKKPTKKSFAFKSSEQPSTFRCRLDRRPFAKCGHSKTYAYADLAPGRHSFEVFAVDAAGNADPTPAVAHFRVPKPKAAAAKG